MIQKKIMKFKKIHSPRKKLFKKLSIIRLIPNIATVIALCVGLSGIRFAILESYELAVLSILIASIFDILDGRLARMLRASSEFGAELDSLSDFISFGVSPVVIIYIFTLHNLKGFGWTFVLFFAVCSALRLARFNISQKDTNFFIGVPAPAGAFIAMLPMMFCFSFKNNYDYGISFISAFFLLISGILMISNIPTFSIKSYNIPRRLVAFTLVLASILVAIFIVAPWETLMISGIIYLGSMPVSYYTFKKKVKIY